MAPGRFDALHQRRMGVEQHLQQGVWLNHGEIAPGQLPIERNKGRRIAGEAEGSPVRLHFKAPGKGTLGRAYNGGEESKEEQGQRQRPEVSRDPHLQQHLVERIKSYKGAGSTEQQPSPEMATTPVTHLVGHHGEHLFCGKVLQKRIVKHDPLRCTEPAEIGVGLAGATASIGDEDPLHPNTRFFG